MKAQIISRFIPITKKKAPLMLSRVQAGFPSPADDYIENVLDLNELFQVDPSSTFFAEVIGESMINTGITPGDILCVRKDLEAKDGKIVVAGIDGEFTVKRLHKSGNKIVLEAANEDYPDIVPESEQDVRIWGVVTGFVRLFK